MLASGVEEINGEYVLGSGELLMPYTLILEKRGHYRLCQKSRVKKKRSVFEKET
jgi:hypothetical protein